MTKPDKDKAGVFDAAVKVLDEARGEAEVCGLEEAERSCIKAIALLTAAGEVRFDDIGRADESDVIPLLKAIFEARRDR